MFPPLAFVLAAQRTPRHCVRELTSSSSSTSCVKHFAICMLVNPADQTLPVQLFVVLVVGLLQQSDSVLLRIDNIINTMVCIDIVDI